MVVSNVYLLTAQLRFGNKVESTIIIQNNRDLNDL